MNTADGANQNRQRLNMNVRYINYRSGRGNAIYGKHLFVRLSVQTDFALRTLMFLAAKPGHHSIAEIADSYGISRNHLMKVAQRVVAEGFVKSVRGRGGGLMLARDSDDINVGAVVRTIEDFGAFVECFEPLGKGCVVTPVCGLRHVLAGGIDAFFDHLDRFTIADLVADPAAFRAALRQAESPFDFRQREHVG